MTKTSALPKSQLDRGAIDAIIDGSHADPFAVLGLHDRLVRTLQPGATTVSVTDPAGTKIADLDRVHSAGLFEGEVPGLAAGAPYRLRVGDEMVDDPYRFPRVFGEMDAYLFAEGNHLKLYERLGAHPMTLDGIEGVNFAVWAPNASRCSVVGEFNDWDGRRHVMRKLVECGVFEIFVPGVERGELYKFEILDAGGALLPLKADPFGFRGQHPPENASVVHGLVERDWQDQEWMATREAAQSRRAPMTIYEVHLGSWMRVPEQGNRYLSYAELGEKLVPYVKEQGFTHIELMPIHEYPFDGSWGYQPIGLYAPTIRYGTAEEFAEFVDRCHQAEIGVIIDWVPGHFPTDAHGLARFDGTALYEHEDPRLGFHQDWNTYIYNYGRNEVANFLLANALFWLDRFHIDGIRVDAVASMLYLNYSRKEGEWVPNKFGGHENLEAIAFLKNFNEVSYGEYPGVVTIAEESTAWPSVSRPTYVGGLGFGFKWNMGWMHDTLRFIGKDTVHRKYHQNDLTFGLLYAFSENFVLPISHDEVVHGKGSLLGRMPGDDWQRFANMRAYLGFMWTHPGKKLIFMGCEFGQFSEWDYNESLRWDLLQYPSHAGIQRLVRDLNLVLRNTKALHELDCESEGFEWIDASDSEQSVLSFLRKDSDGGVVVVVCNFTPVVRNDYRIGVPMPGQYDECINTDADVYGGSGVGNGGAVEAEAISWHGRPHSLLLNLPPLATLLLRSA
ncbi:MAG: 1,4-alpha-glucan branching protein GlgB [Pseudomonadota bacterium]